MFAQIQQVLSIVSAVLAALATVANINVSHITPILAKIGSLVSSLTTLTKPTDVASVVADLITTISALKSSGVLTDSSPIDQALAALAQFQAVSADYLSGQVALLDANFSYEGVAGDLFAVSKTATAPRAALGLA